MGALSWQDKLRVSASGLMIRFGQLRYDTFTIDELHTFIEPHFPNHFTVDIPSGSGDVVVENGTLTLNESDNRIGLQIFATLSIKVENIQIYRAHIVVTVSSTPVYQREARLLTLAKISVDDIRLVDDDFLLYEESKQRLKALLPGARLGASLGSLVTRSLFNVAGIATAGRSDRLLNYLKLYIDGNKQQVLSYHRAQIEEQVLLNLKRRLKPYHLRNNTWREAVFYRWGKRVSVVREELRFWF